MELPSIQPRWMELPRWFDGRVAYNEQQVTSVTGDARAGTGAASSRQGASLAGIHADVRTLHRTGASGALLRALRSQPARERLDRDGAPAAGPDPRRQGADEPDLPALAPLPREHPEGSRGPDGLPREGLHLGRDPVQRRDQAGAPVRRRGSRPAPPQLHRHRAPAARHPARRALRRRLHPDGEGDAAEHGARRHRAAAEREDLADARQGNAAARRVQPRPDRRGDEEHARPAGRPRARDRARAAGALPPHQEQRRADRRARRRQDRHRRGPGPEDRLRRRAALPRRQAPAGARHLADRRRHQVPRPVRRAPQGDHEGAVGEPERHRVHRRAAHAGRARGRPKARSTPPTSSSRRCRAARSAASARPRRPSTASTSRRTARSSAASRRSRSIRRPRRRRSRSCAASRIATRQFHHVEFTQEAIEAAVYQSSRYITDRFLPDKAIDLIDEAGARAKLREAGYSEEFGEINKTHPRRRRADGERGLGRRTSSAPTSTASRRKRPART